MSLLSPIMRGLNIKRGKKARGEGVKENEMVGCSH